MKKIEMTMVMMMCHNSTMMCHKVYLKRPRCVLKVVMYPISL